MSKFINPLKIKEEAAELEIFEMDGDKKLASTGLILLVRPQSHEDVKRLDKKIYDEAKAVRKSDKAKDDPDAINDYLYERSEPLLKERVRSHIEGWRWADGVEEELASIKFSSKMLNEFLDSKPFGDWIKRQVIDFKAREANFYKRHAKG